MNETRTNFHNQAAQIMSLETLVGQIATLLSKRQLSTLPSTSEINPRREGKEQCNTIIMRSCKEIEGAKRGAIVTKEREKLVEEEKGKHSTKVI